MSSDGFKILVGKNNKQNDHLTLKVADNDDIWMHTKNIPGSHVIIKTNEKNVPDETKVTTRKPLSIPPEYDLRPVAEPLDTQEIESLEDVWAKN